MPPLHVFLPYGPAAASARIRVFEWLSRLNVDGVIHQYVGRATAGVSALAADPLATWQAERRLRREAAAGHQRVLLHREASPLSGGQVEAGLLRAAAFSVFDLDDAMQWDWGDPGGIRRLLPKARKTVVAAKLADRVIAGNETLADWASCWARDVVIIPSCVDPAAYRRKRSYAVADPPRLGWVGSPGAERYLRRMAEPLLEIHRRTGARLSVISSGHASLGPLGAMTDRIEWAGGLAEDTLAGWDVGLMPVPPGLYERGKSGYKLLQYGAAGLPAVASPVGVNRSLAGAMGSPSPSTPGEWVDAVTDLLHAPEEHRRALGERAADVVQTRFSYDGWAGRWKDAVQP